MKKIPDKNIITIYNEITSKLIKKNITISTMESCTAGLISTLLTNEHESSKILKGAFVTYCDEAKIMQGVSKDVIDKYTVYSKETAKEMAKACRQAYKSNIGIGVTGKLDDDGLIVYYAISYKNKYLLHSIEIPKFESRYERKKWVAHNLGVYLDQIIDEY